jgi:hypothetical protein
MALAGAVAVLRVTPAAVVERTPVVGGLEAVVPLAQVGSRLDVDAQRGCRGRDGVDGAAVGARHDRGGRVGEKIRDEELGLACAYRRQRAVVF